MNKYTIPGILLILFVFLSGCSLRGIVINEVAAVAEDGIGAFEQDDDLDLVKSAIPAHIKLLETFLESRPRNDRLLILLSRLYGSYGFLFYEARLEALKLGVAYPRTDVDNCDPYTIETVTAALDRYFQKGMDYALQALETRHGDCREKINNIRTVEPFFNSLTKKDVPALFWYGFNLAEYVNLHKDSVKAVSRAHLAEKAMLRVLALDPEYYHGMANLVLMIYYGSRPPMTGGNYEAAVKYYEKLRQIAGDDFLLADVYYARYCLYQKQDKKKFTEMLNRVIEEPVSGKRYNLFNQAAVLRARLYLGAVVRLF